MTPELASTLERLRADVRADASKLPILFWLRAYATLALERNTPRLRWAKLSGFVSRTAREFGMNGLDHAPGRALLTGYDLLQAVEIDTGTIVRDREALRALDLPRAYEVELRDEYQSQLGEVAAWVNQTWEALRRGEGADGALAAILARWAPAGRSGLLPVLIEAQEAYGWLSPETLTAIAQGLQVPLSEVYGVADFYAHLYTRPVGKTIVRVCDDVPCYLAGSKDLLHRLKNILWIGEGETTSDKAYTLECVPCLGQCDQAPVIMVGHRLCTCVQADQVATLLQE